MSSTRERIMARLRTNVAATTSGTNGPVSAAGDFAPVTTREAAWQSKQPPPADLTEAFIRGQATVGGRVVRVADWPSLGEAVLPWIREYQVRSVVTGTEPRLKPLRQQLATTGLRTRVYDAPQEEQAELLFNTDCGITTARGALADTGTVILRPSPQEPRLLSLAQPVHLVLVEREQLFPNLLAFLETGEYAADMPTNLVLVTGASRTADIEQTLTVGVHGPRVFLVALIG